MYLGEIVEHGAARTVYREPRHPYTRALMSAVPIPDPAARLASPEIVLEGDLPSPVAPPPGCRFHTRCWLAPRLSDEGAGLPPRCTGERPELRDVAGADEGTGHLAACHFSERLDDPTSSVLRLPS